MSNNYISLIALVVAVFFSGVYLRGEGARKKEIKRELDQIREQQDRIVAQVNEINRATTERDQILLGRIDVAQQYIDSLNVEDSLTSAKIAGFGDNIQLLQQDIAKNISELSE